MTIAQQARVDGFLASLAVRGVDLTLVRTSQVVRALVQPDAPDPMEHRHGEPEAVGDKVHILRSQAPAGVGVGDVFDDPDSGFSYRVVEVQDRPANVAVVYRCETAEVTP